LFSLVGRLAPPGCTRIGSPGILPLPSASSTAEASTCAPATGRPASPSARSPCRCSTTVSRVCRPQLRRSEEWFGWAFRGLAPLPVTWDPRPRPRMRDCRSA